MEMRLSIRRWAAWAPGLATSADWQAWAEGKQPILQTGDWPPLSHLDAMFKRRFGQLSRMILQVGHELSTGQGDLRVVFASHYGEINQQYKISRSLIESGEVAPAAFSLSVFNTPSALLSIAEKNHGYASASYGGPAAFSLALVEALALLRSAPDQPVLLLVGDELMPAEYEQLVPGRNQPYAMGLLLANNGDGDLIDLEYQSHGDGQWREDGEPAAALGFLAWLLAGQSPEYRQMNREAQWMFRRAGR